MNILIYSFIVVLSIASAYAQPVLGLLLLAVYVTVLKMGVFKYS